MRIHEASNPRASVREVAPLRWKARDSKVVRFSFLLCSGLFWRPCVMWNRLGERSKSRPPSVVSGTGLVGAFGLKRSDR